MLTILNFKQTLKLQKSFLYVWKLIKTSLLDNLYNKLFGKSLFNVEKVMQLFKTLN